MTNHCKPLQTITNHCKPSQTITNHYKPLQAITNHHKPLQTIANHYKPLQTITNHYKPLQTITNRYKPLQTITNHCKPLQTKTKPAKSTKSLDAWHLGPRPPTKIRFKPTFPCVWSFVYPSPQNTKNCPKQPPNHPFLQSFGKASKPWDFKPSSEMPLSQHFRVCEAECV